MTISFVIPAYNEEKSIGACLESVLREIHRTRADADIVVVNNASTDRTKEIALQYPGVRVVDEPIKGLVHARHAGFSSTKGKLVANVDSDTVLPRGWLTTVLNEFEHNANLGVLTGPFIYSDLSRFERILVYIFYFFGYLIYLLNQYILRKGGMVQGGNFVLRRELWEKAGGFDTSIQFYGEDTDVALRMTGIGEVKWTWKLPMYASGRRLKQEGIFATGLRYAMNFFSVTLWGRPVSKTHTDVRE